MLNAPFDSIFLTSFCMWDFQRQNKAKEIECVAQGFDESQKGEFAELGTESPLFRYALCILLIDLQPLSVSQRFTI